MWNLRDEVLNAATAIGVAIREVRPDEAETILNGVVAKFTDKFPVGHGWLWEHLIDVGGFGTTTHQDPRAWELVGELTGNVSALLFFNQQDEETMFEFEKGSDLAAVLGESSHFEFYVTNAALEYLVCFNHHDLLYAAGSAAPRLQGILAER